MKLSDQELLKSVLYDERHHDANMQLNAELHEKMTEDQLQRDALAFEAQRRQRKKKLLMILTPVCAAILVVGGLLAFEYLSNWGKIHRNVRIATVDVSSMTPQEANSYLDASLGQSAEHPIEISYVPGYGDSIEADQEAPPEDAQAAAEEGGHVWEMHAAEIGLSFDTTLAVEQAYAFGREGDFFQNLWMRIQSYFDEIIIDLAARADDEMAEEAFAPIREVTNIDPVDSQVALQEGSFTLISGSDGIALLEDELIVLIAAAIVENSYQIKAPVDAAHRAIDDANAGRAARTANDAISLPVEVSYSDRSWDFDSADIAGLLDFVRSDELEDEDVLLMSKEPTPTAEIVLETVIVVDEVTDRIVSRLGADVGHAPVDARFSVSGGEVIIHPSEMGSGVDSSQLAIDLSGPLGDAAPVRRSVEVTMNDISPRRSTEDAQNMGIRERISTYTTNFSAGNAPRVNNIQLIARILDGTIIAPGEEFSFNGTTGQRTAARGFQEAGAIIRGEMSTSVGGGICQVSTTLFNATMLAGLNITQRVNHSTFLSAYPPGRDATVAWNGPDFRFRNSHDNYIMIATASTNSSVTISFFGIDPGYTIDIRTGEFRRNNFGTREINDNTIPRGRRIVETAGQRGGTVSVFYTVRDGDRIVREQTFTSRYRTIDEVVRVGTMREAANDDADEDAAEVEGDE